MKPLGAAPPTYGKAVARADGGSARRIAPRWRRGCGGGSGSGRTEDDREAELTFRAPGYNAATFINVQDGSYKLTVSYQGGIGVVNALHRGRDAGSAWSWLIDVSGVFLVLLSLTGLGLLFYLKKVRLKGMLTLIAGALIVVVLATIAT